MCKGATLIILGGLPGTGKTTLGKALSKTLNATYLRIDTIEQRLERLGCMKAGNEGYLIAYDLAADNLKDSKIVIVDSVNSIFITRESWRSVADQSGARAIEVEIVCSDKDEHKRRIEARKPDIKGHRMPTWKDVIECQYEAWEEKDFTVDTADKTANQALKILIKALNI